MTDGNQQSDGVGNNDKVSEPQAEVLQQLMRASALPLIAVNLQGRLEYHADYVAELLKVKTPELVGFNVLDSLNDRDRSVMKAHLDNVIVKKQSARCEVELRMPNGRKQWIRLISYPGAQEDGSSLCWSNIENLSQLRHLEKTEALYQRASDAIRKSETIKEFSHALYDLLRILFSIENGYVAIHDVELDLVKFPYFSDIKDPHPQPRGIAEGLTDYVITTGRLFWLKDEQSGSRIQDGSVQILGSVPSDWIGVPLSCNGKVIGMAAIQTYEKDAVFSSRQISLMIGIGNLFDQFLERMNLEESQNRLSEAVEQADETIVITNARGIIQFVNPAFEKKTGYTREQAVGHSMALINSGKHDEEYFKELWIEISAGKTWRGRFTNRKKDGTLYDEDVVISPIKNKDGEIVNYVSVKRDLSREISTDHDSLSAQRIEVIKKMVESINHDFSNVLMTIRSNAEDIKTQYGKETNVDEADQIITAAEGGEDLVRNLSLLFEHDNENAGIAKLNELLLGFEPTARRLIGEKNNVRLELAPRMEAARLNWKEVEQVLFSLLLRAAESLKQGGDLVELRTLIAPARKETDFMFLDGAPSGQRKCAVIEVADRGVTVPKAEWEAMFHAQDEGSSIGMESIREIVARQHGYIGVKENTPSGLVFRLYFPVVSGGAHEPVELSQPKQELPRGSETILLAEDDEGARRVISRMLQDQGYTVLEAENGAMAIRFMLSRKDSIDLLLTDMMMPDFDGNSLSEQSQSLQPDMKVIFVSGYSRADLVSEGVLDSEKEIPLLKKPFKREELLLLVRQTLDG